MLTGRGDLSEKYRRRCGCVGAKEQRRTIRGLERHGQFQLAHGFDLPIRLNDATAARFSAKILPGQRVGVLVHVANELQAQFTITSRRNGGILKQNKRCRIDEINLARRV